MQGQALVAGTLSAIDSVLTGINAAAQNPRCITCLLQMAATLAVLSGTRKLKLKASCCRYGWLVYNGSVHYWRIARILHREGLRTHLLASQQTVVDAVRKLPDQQGWLASMLLQLALSQLEV